MSWAKAYGSWLERFSPSTARRAVRGVLREWSWGPRPSAEEAQLFKPLALSVSLAALPHYRRVFRTDPDPGAVPGHPELEATLWSLLLEVYEEAVLEQSDRLAAAKADLVNRVAERTEELRGAVTELERASRMKDQFLASMSHELRTPLSAILGLTESVVAGIYGPVTPAQEGALEDVMDGANHLLALINDILDLSRVRAGMMDISVEAVPLSELYQGALHLVRDQANKKDQHLRLTLDVVDSWVETEPRRFRQILVNLLSNAHKFTPEGGQFGLEVARRKGKISFCVWDRGIGIPAGHLPTLFEPFVQLDGELSRRYEGTGLGLALVVQLAELLGADLEAESILGEGSRFTVSLPEYHPS